MTKMLRELRKTSRELKTYKEIARDRAKTIDAITQLIDRREALCREMGWEFPRILGEIRRRCEESNIHVTCRIADFRDENKRKPKRQETI